jgi:pyrrolidone-carboxylate peptidase
VKPLARLSIVVMFGLGAAVVPGQATATVRVCADPNAPLTVEEQRLALPAPAEILRRSGFGHFARSFTPALCHLRDAAAAERAFRTEGRQLWEAATARAQGRRRFGDLPVTDDRPLYWARLQLTRAVRQWTPSFELGDDERAELLDTLERSSRGQDSIRSSGPMKRILISGFDPFLLDQDIRRSNPSGAAALALDGTVVRTAAGLARIETAMFPVLWDPFAQGVVEQTLLPHLREVDMFATVSQGRVGQFDVERFNGRWRGGFPDNDNASSAGVIPIPEGVPTVEPAPEFVATTLPYAEIVATSTGRFPVFDHTSVVEIPVGETDPVTRPDGPTLGSVAREGGGGDYLSNEIAYRATLLRDALGLHIPGGHLHTPVLKFADGNSTELTDPTFEANQRDIVDQTRAILVVAAGTL